MQIAVIPQVIRKIVARESIIIHRGTCSSRLVRKTSSSPRINNGTKLSQSLLQSRVRREIGAVCRTQKAFPSRLTAGKANRIATALSTKPASAKFAKETTVFKVAVGSGERSSGRTLKL